MRVLAQLASKTSNVEHKPISLRFGPPRPPSHTRHAPPPALSRGRRAISSCHSPAPAHRSGSGFDMACWLTSTPSGSRAVDYCRGTVATPGFARPGTSGVQRGHRGHRVWKVRMRSGQSSWCTHTTLAIPSRCGQGWRPSSWGYPGLSGDIRGASVFHRC